MKLNARQLRDLEETNSTIPKKRYPIYLILDNIYDTYNIGGLFRLSDALAIEKLFICGNSEIPPNVKIKRASIGTYKVVPWEYKNSVIEAIEDVHENLLAKKPISRSLQIVSIEQTTKSVPYQTIPYACPITFIVGNETSGVTKEALKVSNYVAEIPMLGVNISLNVIVSASIVMYHAYKSLGFL